MAVASRMGPWRGNRKHWDCLMLRRVSVHNFITLWTPRARRIRQHDSANRTPRNITVQTEEHYCSRSANQDSFLVLHQVLSETLRLSNANPGTKNRSFEMELKISECSITAGSWGLMGETTTSVSLSYVTDSLRHFSCREGLHPPESLW